MKSREFFLFVAYRVAVYLLKLLSLFIIRVRVNGLENIPKSGGLLIVANHLSFLDPPVLGMIFHRQLLFLAKPKVINSFFVRLNWAYPIGDIKSLRRAINLLKEGKVVCLFPEGQIKETDHGELLQRGFYVIAKASGAKVLPVGIWGSQKAWPLGNKLPRPGTVRVNIGESFTIDQMDLNEALSKLTRELKKLINQK